MAKIHKLSPQLANLIAAGEVVERPGSVAKELVENAIDAGAKNITVEIKNGGVTYLRVTDDGSGILPEDVRTAFLRHATSKIQRESDLLAIGTLGFRGEALAAVAAVAKVDLFTRTRASDEGVQITIEGGQETGFSETGCQVGTTIIVRELFYNVPARAKFLKKDNTEASYVEAAVMHAAISRPDIAFKMIRDGRESFYTGGDGKMQNAVYSIYGGDVARQLIAVAGSFGEVSLEGFITAPGMTRANKNMQVFFVNGRYVRSRLLSAALEEAYKGRVMTGRYPGCFINLHVNLAAVDVNVHPAKLEIKFSREKEIFSAVYHAIATAFTTNDQLMQSEKKALRPQPEDHVTAEQQEIAVPQPAAKPVPQPAPQKQEQALRKTVTYQETFQSQQRRVAAAGGIAYQTRQTAPFVPAVPNPMNRQGIMVEGEELDTACEKKPALLYETAAPAPAEKKAEAPAEPAPAPQPAPAPVQEDKQLQQMLKEGVRVIGEALHTYIIVEYQGGICLIDKHAAHEKMIYDTMLAQLGQQPSQMLLVPETVAMPPQEKALCLQHQAALQQAGFEVEDFGGASVLVRQIPAYLDQEDIAFVLSDIVSRLQQQRPADNQVLDELLKSIACKSAVKAGQYSSTQELQQFAEQVLAMPNVRNCPHGRPVLLMLSRYELEKQFKRVQ